LINSARNHVDVMIAILENALTAKTIDFDKVTGLIDSEKQNFYSVAKEELAALGIEVRSLEKLIGIEDAVGRIFGSRFLDSVKKAKNSRKWNKRIRRVALAYVAAFYLGFNIAAPAYLTSLQLNPLTVHYDMTSGTTAYQHLQPYSTEVVFSSYDRIQTYGLLIKNKEALTTTKAVLFIHGKDHNSSANIQYINYLRNTTRGIDFLTIDLRNHGVHQSSTPFKGTTFGEKEAFDVIGAVKYLSDNGYDEVILYGHSIGGAAIINAVGKYGNLMPKNMQIKGLIVEKTFADLRNFLKKNYNNMLGNFGLNLLSASTNPEKYPRNIVSPSDFQKELIVKAAEKMGGFKASENVPAKTIRKIRQPVLVIGTKDGDNFLEEEDARILAKNAPDGAALIVKSKWDKLFWRHNREDSNPEVLAAMEAFVKGNL